MGFKNLTKSLTNFLDVLANSKKIKFDEINKISFSLKNYSIAKRTGFRYKTKIRKGDICRIDLGFNVEPEMSYQHMCIILGKHNHLYQVCPITTLNSTNKFHMNAFHPIHNKSGNKNFYLLKQTEFSSFLAHDSVLKCEDIRSISEKRILANITNISSHPLYKNIMDCIHYIIFPEFNYEIDYLKEENMKMKKALNDLLQLSVPKDVITVYRNDEVNIGHYCKYTYGNLEEISVDTNDVGLTKYIVILHDAFGNSIEKEITINVIEKQDKLVEV